MVQAKSQSKQIKILIALVVTGVLARYFTYTSQGDIEAAKAAAAKNAEKMHAQNAQAQSNRESSTPPPSPPASGGLANSVTPFVPAQVQPDEVPSQRSTMGIPHSPVPPALEPVIDINSNREIAAASNPPPAPAQPSPLALFKSTPIPPEDREINERCSWTYRVDEEQETFVDIAYRFGRESAWPALALANKASQEDAPVLHRGKLVCIDFGDN